MRWIHWSVFGDKAESAGFRTSLSEEEVQLVGDVGPLRLMVVSMIFVGYPCPEAMIQFDKFSAWSELKAPTRSFISIIVCHKSWFTGWILEFVSTLRMVIAISLRLLAQLKGSYLHLLGKRSIILSLIWTLVQKPRQCHDPFVWEHFVLSNVWEPRFHKKKNMLAIVG